MPSPISAADWLAKAVTTDGPTATHALATCQPLDGNRNPKQVNLIPATLATQLAAGTLPVDRATMLTTACTDPALLETLLRDRRKAVRAAAIRNPHLTLSARAAARHLIEEIGPNLWWSAAPTHDLPSLADAVSSGVLPSGVVPSATILQVARLHGYGRWAANVIGSLDGDAVAQTSATSVHDLLEVFLEQGRRIPRTVGDLAVAVAARTGDRSLLVGMPLPGASVAWLPLPALIDLLESGPAAITLKGLVAVLNGKSHGWLGKALQEAVDTHGTGEAVRLVGRVLQLVVAATSVNDIRPALQLPHAIQLDSELMAAMLDGPSDLLRLAALMASTDFADAELREKAGMALPDSLFALVPVKACPFAAHSRSDGTPMPPDRAAAILNALATGPELGEDAVEACLPTITAEALRVMARTTKLSGRAIWAVPPGAAVEVDRLCREIASIAETQGRLDALRGLSMLLPLHVDQLDMAAGEDRHVWLSCVARLDVVPDDVLAGRDLYEAAAPLHGGVRVLADRYDTGPLPRWAVQICREVPVGTLLVERSTARLVAAMIDQASLADSQVETVFSLMDDHRDRTIVDLLDLVSAISRQPA